MLGIAGVQHVCAHSMWLLCAGLLLAGARPADCVTTQQALLQAAPNNGELRLMDGSTFWQGRLEVYYNGTWGTVCDDSWDDDDAVVACRQLGLRSSAARAVQGRGFSSGAGPIWLDDVECSGNEARLLDCAMARPLRALNCGHNKDAGVICSPAPSPPLPPAPPLPPLAPQPSAYPAVRLVGGPSNAQGRLEVLYNGKWGTVCDDSFGMDDAVAVCRQLGYNSTTRSGVRVMPPGAFGSGTGTIWLDEVQCPRNATNLAQCTHRAWGVTDCAHDEDVGIDCGNVLGLPPTPPPPIPVLASPTLASGIRLAGGDGITAGRLEILAGGSWGTVCSAADAASRSKGFDAAAAQVVCRQLGLLPERARPVIGTAFGPGYAPVLLVGNATGSGCSGSEARLTDAGCVTKQLSPAGGGCSAGLGYVSVICQPQPDTLPPPQPPPQPPAPPAPPVAVQLPPCNLLAPTARVQGPFGSPQSGAASSGSPPALPGAISGVVLAAAPKYSVLSSSAMPEWLDSLTLLSGPTKLTLGRTTPSTGSISRNLTLQPGEYFAAATIFRFGVVAATPSLCSSGSNQRCVVGLELTTNLGRRLAAGPTPGTLEALGLTWGKQIVREEATPCPVGAYMLVGISSTAPYNTFPNQLTFSWAPRSNGALPPPPPPTPPMPPLPPGLPQLTCATFSPSSAVQGPFGSPGYNATVLGKTTRSFAFDDALYAREGTRPITRIALNTAADFYISSLQLAYSNTPTPVRGNNTFWTNSPPPPSSTNSTGLPQPLPGTAALDLAPGEHVVYVELQPAFQAATAGPAACSGRCIIGLAFTTNRGRRVQAGMSGVLYDSGGKPIPKVSATPCPMGAARLASLRGTFTGDGGIESLALTWVWFAAPPPPPFSRPPPSPSNGNGMTPGPYETDDKSSQQDDDTLGTGARIGIIAGCVLGALLLLAVFVLVWRRHVRRAHAQQQQAAWQGSSNGINGNGYHPQQPPPPTTPSDIRLELGASNGGTANQLAVFSASVSGAPQDPRYPPILPTPFGAAAAATSAAAGASLSTAPAGQELRASQTSVGLTPRTAWRRRTHDPEESVRQQLEVIRSVQTELEAVEALNTPRASDAVRQGASELATTAREYLYNVVAAATDNFSAECEVARGQGWAAYRAQLDGQLVAVMVLTGGDLKADASVLQGPAPSLQLLCSIHHPNIVCLLGACSGQGRQLLVYELVGGGSLQQHLDAGQAQGRDGGGRSPAGGWLDWRTRTRVLAELAGALLHLHATDPPLAHMHLKARSVLLDEMQHVKLAGLGKVQLVQQPRADGPRPPSGVQAAVAGGGNAAPPDAGPTAKGHAGCASVQSDTYALGLVALQLLTGSVSTEGLPQRVAAARSDPSLRSFAALLDDRAGGWPPHEAVVLADLALACARSEPDQRPDIREVVLPTLLQLKQRVDLYEQRVPSRNPSLYGGESKLQQQGAVAAPEPPPMFLCPITQCVMVDPVVAADGYTYERHAIQHWLRRGLRSGRPVSPMTNLPLEHAQLLPNRVLTSAIKEWQEKHSA